MRDGHLEVKAVRDPLVEHPLPDVLVREHVDDIVFIDVILDQEVEEPEQGHQRHCEAEDQYYAEDHLGVRRVIPLIEEPKIFVRRQLVVQGALFLLFDWIYIWMVQNATEAKVIEQLVGNISDS